MPRTAGKMDKRVPEQSRPDTSLEAKRTTLTLFDSGASREQTGRFGKDNPVGEHQGGRRRGIPAMRGTGSQREAAGRSSRG